LSELVDIREADPRTGKQSTVLAGVATDGSYLNPIVVIPRKTYDENLALFGRTAEKIVLSSRASGYGASAIVYDWMETMFLPALKKRRHIHSYAGSAFMMLDNCSGRTSEDFRGLCAHNMIIPIFLPPHSSTHTQILDLSIFGLTKRIIARVNRIDTCNIQRFHIASVVCSFESAANPMKISQSFQNAGMSLMTIDDRLFCTVTPETARCVLEREKLITAVPTPEEEEEEELEHDDDNTDDDELPDDLIIGPDDDLP
jgi:hypothetical protein